LLSLLAIANYRSLRDVVLPLSQLNIITGPNGSGKSSVYRALKLLADIAQGGAVATLAKEGGFESTLWAGPEQVGAAIKRGDYPLQGLAKRSAPVNLRLGFAASEADEFSYCIDIGLPVFGKSPQPSAFSHDPEIKQEHIWAGTLFRPASQLVERKVAGLRARLDGQWTVVGKPIPPWASMMTEFADPARCPEMLTLREQMRSWRFYDHFRCDAGAPARQPQLGSRTTIMASDGSDFAAALQTIIEIGDDQALDSTIDDAFPGAKAFVQVEAGRFEVCMQQPGMLRPLRAAELSDGTLRYLLWAVALLTPRAPQLMVLNEPETSLHPDLLPALGRLIVQAAKHTQMIVVSHAPRLIAAMEDAARDIDVQSITLQKEWGETQIANLHADDIPRWTWPSR
jgi:predicted ATPase